MGNKYSWDAVRILDDRQLDIEGHYSDDGFHGTGRSIAKNVLNGKGSVSKPDEDGKTIKYASNGRTITYSNSHLIREFLVRSKITRALGSFLVTKSRLLKYELPD